MQNPIRGILHGGAAALSLAATGFLVARAATVPGKVAVTIFGMGMLSLFTTSSLYHSVPWPEEWKRRMQRLDHSMIYVMIAGTYTPVIFAILDPPVRWWALAVAWGIVAGGVVQKWFVPQAPHWLSVAMSTTLGWLAVFIAWPFVERLGWLALLMGAVGGVLYTVGMIFLVTNRPRLWPRVFSYHEVFHVLVVAGAALHFVMIWRWVTPRIG